MGKIERCLDLFPPDRGEVREEITKRVATAQVIHETPNGHASPDEDRGSRDLGLLVHKRPKERLCELGFLDRCLVEWILPPDPFAVGQDDKGEL